MAEFTKERIIEELKASTQNASGMFEISEDTICNLMSMLTNAAPQLPQPAMMTPNYSRFLSDVMTAAGLLSHGRRDKALATRLADFCVAERMGMDTPCRTAMLNRQCVDHVDGRSPSTIQPAPVLDSLPKNSESPTGINQGKAEPVSQPYKLPMQPLVIDDHGTLRFKENPIVRKLLDYATEHGYGLNEMALEQLEAEDRMQLAQLIGYSLSGYGSLSYVTNESYERAAAAPQQEADNG